VDGKTLSEDDDLVKAYDSTLNQKEYYKPLTNGEIGCFLSHRRAWQYILDNQLPYAVILEDDFEVINNLNIIDDFIQNNGIEWDYIKLSNYPNNPRKCTVEQSFDWGSLVTFDKIPAGTCAQLVSQSGAKKLLVKTQRFGRPVDVDLQFWWEYQLKVYGLSPFPFSPQPDVISDITSVANRKHVEKRRLRRLYQQIRFKILDMWFSMRKI
jgi:glycosyl transferase family 25